MQHKLNIIILISLFAFASTASGQKLVNSPYSRFNLGSMEPAGSFRSIGMGGITTAMRDNGSLFFSNPASYSSLDTTSFLFDFGLDYSTNKLTGLGSPYTSDDMNFDHLMMGFSLLRGWGFGVGVVPVSNGYYKMYENMLKTDQGYDPLVGEYVASHSGEGGFNNFFLGTGIKINKNFSAGVNMTVLFGQITRKNQFNFFNTDPYDNSYFHDISSEKLQMGGVNLNYGLQYSANLKNNYFFNAGVSLNSAKHYNSSYEKIALTYTAYGTNDTISNISDNSSSTYIPGTLSIGISYGKKNKFTTGIDYITTKWSDAIIRGATGYTADTRSLLFGAEFIPDRFSNYSFLKRMEYRIGGHIGDNYLFIDQEQLKEYGASFGIGIPLRRTLSTTNIFVDFTRKTGKAGSSLPTENYITLGISLNIYDPYWFLKRKYE